METVQELLELLDALPASIALWDRDVRLRYANARARDRFGRPTAGTSLTEIVRPDAVELSARYIDGALAGRPQQVERAMVAEDGRRYNAHHIWHVPNVVGGEVTGYCAFAVDVTASLEGQHRARRDREQAASHAERQRAADDLDRHNVFDDLAGALRRLDSAAMHASDLLPHLDAVVDTIEKTTGELRATFPGTLFYDPAPLPRLAFPPMSGPIEGPEGVPGVAWPQTLSGRGWDAAGVRAVLDLLPAAVAVWDGSHSNVYANRAAVSWFGHDDVQGVVGRHASEIVGPDAFAANSGHVDAALRGETFIVQRSIARPDGDRHVQAYYAPRVRDGAAGKVIDGVYIMVADVTDRVRGELALQDLRAEIARTKERVRIADALHNLVIQRLFAASLAATIPAAVPDKQLRTVQDGLVAALDDIESALSTLNASAPQLDLLPALAHLVHEAARPRGLAVAVETVGAVEYIPSDVGAQVLLQCERVLRTLDTGARGVGVTLAADEQEVHLRVVSDPGGTVTDWRVPTPHA